MAVIEKLIEAVAKGELRPSQVTGRSQELLERASTIMDRHGRRVVSDEDIRLDRIKHVETFVPVADPIPNPKSPLLVITVAVGPEHEDLLKISAPLMRAYAKRIGADFMALTGVTQCWWGLEKFRIRPFVELYERTLFLDADILVRDGSPSLFDTVPKGSIGMHNDRPAQASMEWSIPQRSALWASQDVPDWHPEYLRNSGVVVCDQMHADIWTPPPKKVPGSHCDEQFWIERLTRHYHNYELPLEFNTQWYFKDFAETMQSAWFVHFANCPAGQRKALMLAALEHGNKRVPYAVKTTVCGCTHRVDSETGVIKRHSICEAHLSERIAPDRLPLSYFLENLGAAHVNELTASVGPIPQGKGLAIEIGAGASNYQPHLLQRGYSYIAVDPAASLASHYEQQGVEFRCGGLETVKLPKADLVLMAHSLEHVDDLAKCMSKLRETVRPGGLAYFVLPYGPDDFNNPEHDWFFTPESLAGVLVKYGFSVDSVVTKNIIPKERFIYCRATRR